MRMTAITLTAAVATGASAGLTTVAQWNFNGPANNQVPGGELSPAPSTGSGTASLIGGVTAAVQFGSGIVNGGSSDPVTTAPPNYGWQTTTYASQGTQNGERGVQFKVSTEGFENVAVSWDQRHSNTSSRFVQFLYTLDGVTFTSDGLADGGLFIGASGDTWFNTRSVDLSAIPGAANNPNFGFRIVAVFAPASSAYAASNGASSYGTAGTWRFDMVTINGNLVPAPGAIALLGVAGLIARRRR